MSLVSVVVLSPSSYKYYYYITRNIVNYFLSYSKLRNRTELSNSFHMILNTQFSKSWFALKSWVSRYFTRTKRSYFQHKHYKNEISFFRVRFTLKGLEMCIYIILIIEMCIYIILNLYCNTYMSGLGKLIFFLTNKLG